MRAPSMVRVAALMIAMLTSWPAQAVEDEKTYVGPVGPTNTVVCPSATLPACVGGASMVVEPSSTTVDIAVEDITGLAVRAAYSFTRPGLPTAPVFFCSSVQDVPIPEDARNLVVRVHAFGNATCPDAQAVAGTIRATFSS